MLEDLTIKLPLIDAVKMIPSLRSWMKGLVSGKITGDNEVMLLSKECSAVLQNKPIKKLGDPGKFVLSMQIGKTVFACSLCDLGSSVNLMPHSVAKRLGSQTSSQQEFPWCSRIDQLSHWWVFWKISMSE